ncbi:hypothetical protein F2Q70_00002309 [Brassica cretica]|uniref:Glycine-rich protein n=1 Tax=Brassica cretica TaxID=69181 RepID=A0A8S9J0H7_BRACR|nr:hypothetical protein F2Q70_00002309 [Brassica cretica]
MNTRAFVVWCVLLAAVLAATAVASVDDAKQAGANQVDELKSSCKYGTCEHGGEISFEEAHNAKNELNQGIGGFDEVIGGKEDESKYNQGGGGGQGGQKGRGGGGQGGQKEGGGGGQGGQKGGGGHKGGGGGGGQGGHKGGGGGGHGQGGRGSGGGGGGSGRGGDGGM